MSFFDPLTLPSPRAAVGEGCRRQGEGNTLLEGDFDYTESGNEIYIKFVNKRRIAVVVAESTEKIVTVYQIED